MKITEIYINHFGALHNRSFTFTDGLNVLCENNGFGKSTLLGFIKAMFYGFFETTSKSLEQNDRKKYLPWDATACGGALTFEHEGEVYRIERTFGATPKGDTLKVFEERFGRETLKFGTVPGETLFGIDGEGFLRSLALSERVFEEKEQESITDRLSSLVGTGGSMDGLEDGLLTIKKQTTELKRRGRKGDIDTTKAAIASLDASIHRLEEGVKSIPAIRDRLDTLRAEAEALTGEREKLEEELRDDPTLGMEIVKREELARKKAELKALGEKLAYGVPTQEQIERMQQCEGRYSEEELAEYKQLNETFTGFNKGIFEAQKSIYRKLMFLQSTPRSRDFFSDYPYMRDTDDITEDEVKQFPLYNKRARGKIAALALFILGALSLGFGFLVPALFITAALFIAGGVVALILAPKTVLNDEKAKRIAKIEGEAKPYGKTLLELWMKKAQYQEELEREVENRKECERLLEYLRLYGYCGEDFTEGFPYVQGKWERYEKLRQSGLDKAEEDRLALARFKRAYAAFGEPLYENLRIALLKKADLESACRMLTDELSSPTLSQREAKQARKKEIEDRLTSLQKTIYETNAELLAREEDYDTIEEKKAERDELLAKNEHAEYRLRILEKTAEMLERAKESMQGSYLIPMRKSFDTLLTQLTDKEAGDVFIDGSFKVSSRQGGVTKSMDAMSRGERDLYLLISRLAVVDTLYPEGMLPPVFLDDPFVAFDDGRTARALDYLAALGERRQIIYLTCSLTRTK